MRRGGLRNRLGVLLARLALGVALLGGSSCASTGTIVAHDGTKVRRPHDLRGAMRALDRLLSPEEIEQLRSGELDPASLHMGLGMFLRSHWGLWHRSPLARWFRLRGVWHADDMSGIILESYVRRLRGEPIRLREQIAYYEAYWKAAEARHEEEIASGPRRAARAAADRMGWSFTDRDVAVLPFPTAEDAPFVLAEAPFERRPWRLEPYRGGVLVLVQPTYAEHSEPRMPWHAGIVWLEPDGSAVHPAQRVDCPEIHDVLTIGTTTHWLCRADAGWTLIHEPAAGEAEHEPLAIVEGPVRLGSAGDELLVLDPRRLYRRDARAGAWEVVHEHDREWLPPNATPPRLIGDHLYLVGDFHDMNEHNVLRWDVTAPSADPERGSDLWIEPYYGRWANRCYALLPSEGGLWVTGGHRFYATLVRVEGEATKLAVLDGSVDRPPLYEEGLIAHPELDRAALRRQIPATAIAEVGDTLYLAGDVGLFRSHAGRVEPVVRFAADPREVEPREASTSAGPYALVVLEHPDRSPSFVLATSRLAVVVAKPEGHALGWPALGEPIVLGSR